MEQAVDPLKWFASLSGIGAALLFALDMGRRLTGWGFVLFLCSSCGWIAGAVLTGDWALTTQNMVLFGINLLGVHRYLWRDADA